VSNWCVRCLRHQDEAAGPECKNTSWHTGLAVVAAQPGTCWRCKCDAHTNDDACGCCHVAPCEMER